MILPPFLRWSWNTSFQWRIPFVFSLFVLTPAVARGQRQDASVEALANVLAAEDARNYDGPLLRTAARNSDPTVRRHVALAIGRIGSSDGLPTLLELITDPDSIVQADAVFALGLLRDSTAIPALQALVLKPAPGAAQLPRIEAVSAIALIGTTAGEQFFSDLLGRSATYASSHKPPGIVDRALAEAWRLGPDAPVALILPFAVSPDPRVRWHAVFSLGRIHTLQAAGVLLLALEDSVPLVRATAVRELVGSFADSAGIDRKALAVRVRRLAIDPDPLVRIAALRSLGTLGSAASASTAIERLGDSVLNVRVQAIQTLGALGGPAAKAALMERVDSGLFAMRRVALVNLALVSRNDAMAKAAAWLRDRDWRIRATAAEALGFAGGDSAATLLTQALNDADARVSAAAFSGLVTADNTKARALARTLLLHPDAEVRALAAAQIAGVARPADITALMDGYARSVGDPIPDARLSMLDAMARVALKDPSYAGAVADSFMQRFPKTQDYLVRRVAALRFPILAARWPAPTPVETGLDLDDYRDIVNRLLWPAEKNGTVPTAVIETDRGKIEITLNPADAPLTISALMRLINRRYFDGGSWHRVVPGFVVQDGDPRGDGSGGPGFALRDELGRRTFETGVVGIALDGPDTGGSQYFITLAPQPQLNASYTVIGRVNSGLDVLAQLVQGDRIRSIRIKVTSE
jgi:cyclophilin family peptidyl-prolyl cis-trans isomerase/HEAT repeat protein